MGNIWFLEGKCYRIGGGVFEGNCAVKKIEIMVPFQRNETARTSIDLINIFCIYIYIYIYIYILFSAYMSKVNHLIKFSTPFSKKYCV